MQLKPSTLTNIVSPFGVTGALTAKTFAQRFRTFSVHNTTGLCTVTVGGTDMVIPVGVTVNFDAGTQPGVTNKFKHNSFTVTAEDCVIIGTL